MVPEHAALQPWCSGRRLSSRRPGSPPTGGGNEDPVVPGSSMGLTVLGPLAPGSSTGAPPPPRRCPWPGPRCAAVRGRVHNASSSLLEIVGLSPFLGEVPPPCFGPLRGYPLGPLRRPQEGGREDRLSPRVPLLIPPSGPTPPTAPGTHGPRGTHRPYQGRATGRRPNGSADAQEAPISDMLTTPGPGRTTDQVAPTWGCTRSAAARCGQGAERREPSSGTCAKSPYPTGAAMLVREPSHFGSACHAWESSDYRASSPNMGLYKLRSHHPSSTQQRRDPHGGDPNSHCSWLKPPPPNRPNRLPARQPAAGWRSRTAPGPRSP